MRRKPGPKPKKKPSEDFSDPFGFPALLAHYREHLKVHNYSPDTLRSAGNALKLFTEWAAERSLNRPAEITRAILERYQRHLFHHEDVKGRKLGLRSQAARLSAVRGFFRYLARQNLILHNPANELEFPRTEKRLPRQVLTLSEMEKVLSQPNISDPIGLRDRAIMETLYSTAMRRMELTRLKLHDVDTERGLVLIRQGKGRKDRMVPIGDRALVWIQKYLDDVRPKLAVEPDENFIFLANYGDPLTTKHLSRTVHVYVEKANLGKTGSCHLFRHTAATLMLEGGADIRYIQQLLGHADVSTTQIYTHVAIGKLKAVHSSTHPGAQFRRRDHDAGDEHTDSNEREREELLSTLAAEDDDPDDER